MTNIPSFKYLLNKGLVEEISQLTPLDAFTSIWLNVLKVCFELTFSNVGNPLYQARIKVNLLMMYCVLLDDFIAQSFTVNVTNLYTT